MSHSLFFFPSVKRKIWVVFKLKKMLNFLFLNFFLISYTTGVKILRVLREMKKKMEKEKKKRIPRLHTKYISSSCIVICFHKRCWISSQGSHLLLIITKLLFWNWGTGRFINPRFLILSNLLLTLFLHQAALTHRSNTLLKKCS